MSFPSRRLRLTGAARRDIRAILSYTQDHWGVEQRAAYGRRLDETFALILDNPLIGLDRADLGLSIRTRLIEHHIVYYQVLADGVRVLRVMHERTNPVLRLVEEQEKEG